MDAATVFMAVIATTADALTGADTVTGTEPKIYSRGPARRRLGLMPATTAASLWEEILFHDGCGTSPKG